MRLLTALLSSLVLLVGTANAQFGYPPVNPTLFQVAGTTQTPQPARVNFSTGLTGSLSAGTLTITVGSLSATYCALAGCTMAGNITLANSSTALTAGNYALNIKAGSTSAGIVLTGISGDTPANNAVTITNANLLGSPGFTPLAVNSGSASLNTRIAATIDSSSFIGYHCSVAEDIITDAGGATAKKVQCWSGSAGKVQDCGGTANLTTVAGVALTTALGGGIAKVCVKGMVMVLSETDCSTAGLPAGTSGSNAGKIQCGVAPPVNSMLGRVASVVSSGTAMIWVQ